ncbi:MAG: class I SAM-dependent methyltransferase [Nitrososphaera sp.]
MRADADQNNSQYFDLHFHDHSYSEDPRAYDDFIDHVKKHFEGTEFSVLDVGCGKGTFLRRMNEAFPRWHLTGIDTSDNMLASTQQHVPDGQFYNMSAFEIDQLGRTFDIVHMGSLLHHLIGPTRKASMGIALRMMELALSVTSRGGLVVIDEPRYESYLHTELTASIIFYSLKILNKLRIDVSQHFPEIQLGLEVSFFSERQLTKMSRRFVGNNFAVTRKNHWEIPVVYRLFLLKDLGSIRLVLHKV